MWFEWNYQKDYPQQVKSFLKEKKISKGLLAKVKFQGGKITVNQTEVNVLYNLQSGDVVRIYIPREAEHETLLRDDLPIEIVFEDEHLLVVNKPAGIPSIPAQYHPNGTMSNRVKNYICSQNYPNQVVHVVTRLDKDTSGLMIFAKHGYAHAVLDQELQNKTLIKKYQALVTDEEKCLSDHAIIDAPIGRDYTSLLKRMVSSTGKAARTEYWLNEEQDGISLVDIQLHTGRTHQIRVHFSEIGCPLLGDEMYGGTLERGISRQALHCCELKLTHPFTGERLEFKQKMPSDMLSVIKGVNK